MPRAGFRDGPEWTDGFFRTSLFDLQSREWINAENRLCFQDTCMVWIELFRHSICQNKRFRGCTLYHDLELLTVYLSPIKVHQCARCLALRLGRSTRLCSSWNCGILQPLVYLILRIETASELGTLASRQGFPNA